MLVVNKAGSWNEVNEMDPLLRKCLAFSIAHSQGCKINWDTGEVTPPK